MISRKVIVFRNKHGKEPLNEWIQSLRHPPTRRRILQRLLRLQNGNLGDCKSLQGGLYELRLMFGSGYRIYFGNHADTIVVLLCGGDKSTQNIDINNARLYWQEYKNDDKV